MSRLSRDAYHQRYGLTTGDRVRLGDTDLWLRVERDVHDPGDEPLWGYGKNLRSRMTQHDRAGESELDTVIVGVLVVDPTVGVVKADIGIKDGRIIGIGRAGSPDISDGIDLIIGPHTDPVIGYGLIATPGAVDSHVHLISPQLPAAALSGGTTTLITAGFEEPPRQMLRRLAALETWPVNVGLQAGARSDANGALDALLEAGAIGFKIHEDYGAYPEIIDRTLAYADRLDVAVSLHTDGLHESCELEDTVAAIGGRTVHAYHVEGTGGGHVPDLIGLVREPSIICSSTTPTIPWGIAAAAEHLAMTVLNHGGNPWLADDVELIRERIHPATMAAEGPLHELGAIAVVNSDSQGMGRIGETLRRTVQLAHVMKAWRATEAGAGWPIPDDQHSPIDDNRRVLRYLAKVTIEPSIVHGLSEEVGSLRPGRLADVVLWRPAFFGVKPDAVIKGGALAWGPLGEGNASVERSEPTRYLADWGGHGRAPFETSLTFASAAAIEDDRLARRLGTRRQLVAVRGCRGLTRASLWANRTTVPVDVDPLVGTVSLDGRRLAVEPVAEVPLSRRYFMR